MGSFDDEEQQRKQLESRLHEFQKSRGPSKEFTPWTGLYLVGSLGFVVAISILAGLGLGVYLDGRFNAKPWFTLSGLLLGLAAAGKAGYDLVRATLRSKE